MFVFQLLTTHLRFAIPVENISVRFTDMLPEGDVKTKYIIDVNILLLVSLDFSLSKMDCLHCSYGVPSTPDSGRSYWTTAYCLLVAGIELEECYLLSCDGIS